jgi:hypothetical protein
LLELGNIWLGLKYIGLDKPNRFSKQTIPVFFRGRIPICFLDKMIVSYLHMQKINSFRKN